MPHRRFCAFVLVAGLCTGCFVDRSGLVSERADGGRRQDGGPTDGGDEPDARVPDGCVVRAETCDGTDEDCDGVIDGFTRPCTNACGAGVETCTAGEFGTCTAPEPTVETCNDVDDDCDGVIDGFTRPCTNDCGAGVETCTAGVFGACSAPGPTVETCNNADDDCDGVIDGFTRPCTTACGSGVEACTAGTFGACTARMPVAETCNAMDDDCDGTIDEPGVCPCERRTFGGHIYLFCNWGAGWWSARDLCAAAGYRVVTIETDGENTFVASTALGIADEDWWIGYTDQAAENTWVWASGITSTFTAWGAGQPSGWHVLTGEQDCAQITNGDEGHETRNRWNDTTCGTELRFVCESL